MFYEKEIMQEGLTQTKSPYTLEEIPTFDLLEDDDKDIDKRLDETDFINPFSEDIEWIDMFRIERILSKINTPTQTYSQNPFETNYETYDYENTAEQQIPYLLKIFNQIEDDEGTLSPLELKLPKQEEEEILLVLRTPNPSEEEHPEEDQEERLAA